MDTVWIAVVASLQVVILAIAQAWIVSRKERRDYARQDAVADRVAAAAKQAADAATLLVSAQKETIERTDEVARLAAEASAQVQKQLTAIDEQGKKIHILVNSDMTAARMNERDQTKLMLLALRRVQAVNQKMGISSTEDEEREIAAAEARIVKLDQIIADRWAAQEIVGADTKAASTTNPQ